MNRRAPTRRATLPILFAALGLGLPLLSPAALAQGTRDPQAEQYVQAKGQRVIAILADRTRSLAQKEASFHAVIDEVADVPKITNFVLGKYARTITPDQRARFATAFRVYAEKVYEARINEFGGDTLTVTGSQVRKPGDVVVNSSVSGGQLHQPIALAWRVLNSGGAWRVVDVQVKGVWLAITQQQDFVSTIDNAGGNIEVLITQLQQHTQRPAQHG